MKRRHLIKFAIIAVLLTAGIALEVLGVLDAREWLELARGYTRHWWLVAVLIVAQSILFTFALAGSLFLWIAAPLYPPLTATLILTAGSTLGGLGAYFFSRSLTDEWKRKIENSRTYRVLHANDNFFTLFAMRVFPGFPHSVVNYSAGILNARLTHFVAAAILGIFIKTYIYAQVIYGATSALSVDMLLDIKVYGPLLLLSLLGVIGVYINYKLDQQKQDR